LKVLFDHNVPHKLRFSLGDHAVETADALGWAELRNGELLAQAEFVGFEVFLTGDKNLSYQQNLTGRKLAIIVLGTNNWNILKLHTLPVAEALDRATPGSFQTVAFEQKHRSQSRNLFIIDLRKPLGQRVLQRAGVLHGSHHEVTHQVR
jgi:predicted nuclease of predicted toxin-antitoxin system